ncbi:MAG: zinc ribbon domain-containing protein [Clostridia bacterium]|nr:zinc ribbon domain-containing protein [Clostridia bacterium]
MAKYCSNCGAQLNGGASFCPACGAPAEPVPEAAPAQDNTRVTLCPDGKYRWEYAMSLFKNPTVFFLVWKIFFFIVLGIFAFVMILDAFEGNNVLGSLKAFGIALGVMTALVALGYLLYAAIMGGKYIVRFEMDENGVNHKQIEAQAKKARKIGAAAAMGGLASGRFSGVGAGIAASRTEMYSDFSRTRKVKGCPRRGIIKVNGRLDHNMVFARPEDFEFVKQYIISHCPNLKSHN